MFFIQAGEKKGYSSTPGQLTLEQGQHLLFGGNSFVADQLRKETDFIFSDHQFVVGVDLELSDLARNEFGIQTETLLDSGCETRSTGFVTSTNAVANSDLHTLFFLNTHKGTCDHQSRRGNSTTDPKHWRVGRSLSQIEVRYAETDMMGVVHHSHYPVYFEQGRTRFFQEFLRPYQEYESQGLFAPVLSYQVELKGRLTYGETLSLVTFPLEFKGLRITMGYRGSVDDRPVVEGHSVHALTGLGLKPLHPRRLPDCYQELKNTMTAFLAE